MVAEWFRRGSLASVEADRDTALSLELFHSNLELVEVIARQVSRSLNRKGDLDELRSFGREGLLLAARRYDPEQGVPFRGYASYRVRGAMLDGIRRLASLPRRTYEKLRLLESASRYTEDAVSSCARAEGSDRLASQKALDDYLARAATAMALGLVAECARSEAGEPIAVSGEASADDQLAKAQLLQTLRREIETLPVEEAQLIHRHYFEGERFDKVAAELGLSKSWASRLHSRAIARLTKRLSATKG